MAEFIISGESGRENSIAWIRSLPHSQTFVCKISPYKRDRSDEQNALLHVWIGEIAKHFGDATGDYFSLKVWKEQLKESFLGYEDVVLPNGKKVARIKRTRDLGVGEMAEFLTAIQVYAREEFQLTLICKNGETSARVKRK